jgi:hypothetical protein
MTALTCPECSAKFTRTSRARQAFCTPAHRKRFAKVMAQRGEVILPLLLAKSMGRHGGHGGLPAYCRKEADALLARWNVEDREAGRNPSIAAKHKMDMLWRAVDL